MTKHIIIADDHSMIRKGIKLLLTTTLSCKDVYEADSCSGLMSELKKGGCTHLILDVIFSDGTSLEIVPAIRKLYPDVKIMIFSMQPSNVFSDVFKLYDVHHYLSKSSKEDDIISYIRRFLDNEAVQNHAGDALNVDNPFSVLSARELEILHYLLNGHKTTDIARMLNLGDSTVSTFKKRIFEKTGLTSLAQLFELASVYDLGFYLNAPRNGGGTEV